MYHIYILCIYIYMISYKCIINYNYTFWSVCANRVFPSARIGSILAQVLSWDGQEMFISFLPRKSIGNIWKSHEKPMKTHEKIWTWFIPFTDLDMIQFLINVTSLQNYHIDNFYQATVLLDLQQPTMCFFCLIFVTEIDNLPNGKPGI